MASAIDVRLGARIRRARESRGIDRSALAAALACSETDIARIEAGRCRIDARMVHRLSEVLGIGFAELFEFTPQTSPAQSELDTLKAACIDELMNVDDVLTHRLVLSLLWVLREEGVDGLKVLSALTKAPQSSVK